MHDNDDTLVEIKPGVMKPKIVNFYNMTKGGVDITDEMCSIYDVSRICNCWPYIAHILSSSDTSGINASILHPVFPEKEIRRSRLLEDIGMDLVQPQWDMRSELPNLNKKNSKEVLLTQKIIKRTLIRQKRCAAQFVHE
ncbi:hypothetical protein TNCV_1107261 [Trichonephila clavipes]|nr:hypothetical protein TNCV_1107261 [Trichonephila clavipes]